MIERRAFLTGLISLIAAPAIVRAGSLKPVKAGLTRHQMIADWRYIARIVNIEVTEIYGRSPAMEALNLFAQIDAALLRSDSLRKLNDACKHPAPRIIRPTPPARQCP